MCLQFGFVIFGKKDLGVKAAHKMLLKLTPDDARAVWLTGYGTNIIRRKFKPSMFGSSQIRQILSVFNSPSVGGRRPGPPTPPRNAGRSDIGGRSHPALLRRQVPQLGGGVAPEVGRRAATQRRHPGVKPGKHLPKGKALYS